MYNLGIHKCRSGKDLMFVWTEVIAKRWSDEIASCDFKYIKDYFQPRSNHLIVLVNCGRHNKNSIMVALWLHLVRNKVYRTIQGFSSWSNPFAIRSRFCRHRETQIIRRTGLFSGRLDKSYRTGKNKKSFHCIPNGTRRLLFIWEKQ